VPFTIASINQGNEAGVTNVSITVPAAPIFNETKLIPGESVGPEDLEVTNNGDENVLYYILLTGNLLSEPLLQEHKF